MTTSQAYLIWPLADVTRYSQPTSPPVYRLTGATALERSVGIADYQPNGLPGGGSQAVVTG